uniref:Uncharacterized protein n=1 Tax=Meloidogyne enterolobii TaxID=390850 RepID=A0A6V7WBC2_MELEN|nr:unnamed protein product [Meloidogyne enterolobii]
MYFVILKLILFYLYDYVESMQGAHHYYEPSLKRQKITDISDNKKPVLTLDEASNIIKTIYEFSEYTNFKALIDPDFIIGYYEKYYERELKKKFEGINFKTLNPKQQDLLRELSIYLFVKYNSNTLLQRI